MPDIIAQNTEGYDKISRLIGDHINESFKDLFRKISGGGPNALTSFSGSNTKFTQVDLDNFLTVLGGANLNIDFIPRQLKGTKCKFDALEISRPAGSAPSVAAIEGSISIGIGIRF